MDAHARRWRSRPVRATRRGVKNPPDQAMVVTGVEIGNICALGGVGVFVESTNGVIRPQPRSDTQALTAKYRSSFVKIFQTGTIEKVSTSDTNQARVTCRFLLPDGKQKRLDIVVEQHQASWYLSRFDPPGDAVDPKPKRADTRP